MLEPELEETEAKIEPFLILPAGHLQAIKLSDLQPKRSQEVAPNLVEAELCLRPIEKPVAVTDVLPVDGELNIPVARTNNTGASKLANCETLEYCWPAVALADT